MSTECTRCGGTQKLRSGAHCPDCTHIISGTSRPHGHFTFCSCGWRHFETSHQNALGRAAKERAAIRKHLKEVEEKENHT